MFAANIKEWRKNNPEKYKAQKKRWYEKNKLRILLKMQAQHKDKMQKDKDYSKNRRYKNEYGLTLEEYNAILAAQNFKCMICTGDISQGNHALDHCHKTGMVRAFLCNTCNSGIGMLKDNSDICRKAAEYLERYV